MNHPLSILRIIQFYSEKGAYDLVSRLFSQAFYNRDNILRVGILNRCCDMIVRLFQHFVRCDLLTLQTVLDPNIEYERIQVDENEMLTMAMIEGLIGFNFRRSRICCLSKLDT